MFERNLAVYENSLRLSEKSDLSYITQIHINLLHSLVRIQHESLDEDESVKFDAGLVIDAIMAGKQVEAEEGRYSQDINKALQLAKLHYEEYSLILRDDYHDILKAYASPDLGKLGGWFHRLRNNYSYRGHLQENKDVNSFILLIDRLALIDGSGIYVKELETWMEKQAGEFGFEQQAQFIDKIYQIFSDIEQRYLTCLAERDKKYKEKLYQEYIKEGDAAGFHAYYDLIVYNKKNALAQKTFFSEKLTYDLKQIKLVTDKSKDEINLQLKKLKQDIHHVAQDLGLPSKIIKVNKTYVVATRPGDWKDIISPRQQHDRYLKKNIGRAAKITSLVVGFGEGVVAAVGIIAVLPVIPLVAALLTVGLAGWYCNYFLFKDDTNNVLKDFFLKKTIVNDNNVPEQHSRLFLDEKGRPISLTKKILLSVVGVASIGTGFVNGAMSFVCTSNALGAMCASMISSKAILTGICLGLAAVPALGCGIGITCIFFTVLVDFIKNNRLKQIKDYFINTYFSVPWKEMNGKERAKHIGHCFIEVIKLAVGLAVTTVVTVTSFAVFYHKGIELLNKIQSFDASKFVSSVMTWLNALVSTPFTFKKINEQINSLDQRRKTFAKLEDNIKSTAPLSALQKTEQTLQRCKKTMALTTISLNGAGQGGMMSSGDTKSMQIITSASASCNSAFPNWSAAKSGIANGSILPVEQHIEKSKIAITAESKKIIFAKKEPKHWRFFKPPAEREVVVPRPAAAAALLR